MSLRAETDKKFLYKYLLIAIATIAFSGWALYDALINFPTRIPKAAAYEQLLAEPDLSNIERQDRWEVVAAENGWPPEPPAEESVDDVYYKINTNWIYAGVALLIGVPNLVWFFRNMGSWLEMDGNKISNNKGQTVDLSQAVKLDKKKWVKKGIALLTYKSEDGAEKTFVLDDMKYQRQPVDQMMARIEETIGTDCVINGPTEVELTKQAAEKAAERKRRLAAAEAKD